MEVVVAKVVEVLVVVAVVVVTVAVAAAVAEAEVAAAARLVHPLGQRDIKLVVEEFELRRVGRRPRRPCHRLPREAHHRPLELFLEHKVLQRGERGGGEQGERRERGGRAAPSGSSRRLMCTWPDWFR